MQFLTSSIGRKILMAITGQCMVLFAVIHLLGNTTIFGWLDGGINAYAHHLHSLPLPIIMGFRLGLLALVCVHIWFGIQLTIENRGGRPQQYAVKCDPEGYLCQRKHDLDRSAPACFHRVSSAAFHLPGDQP